MSFYWQLLIILFADDRAKKNMELHLLLLQERKNIFLAQQILGTAARRGHGFHTRPKTSAHVLYDYELHTGTISIDGVYKH